MAMMMLFTPYFADVILNYDRDDFCQPLIILNSEKPCQLQLQQIIIPSSYP